MPLAITKSAPSFTNVITVVARSADATVASTKCSWKFQLSFFIFFTQSTMDITVAANKRIDTNRNKNDSGIRKIKSPPRIMARPFARSDLLNCLTMPDLATFLPAPSRSRWSGREAAAILNPSSSPNTTPRTLSHPLVPWAENCSTVIVPSSLMASKSAFINLFRSSISTEYIHLSNPLLIFMARGSMPSGASIRSP